MKNYELPMLEIITVENGDILTFSLGQVEGFDPTTGTEGPIVNTPVTDSDYGNGSGESN